MATGYCHCGYKVDGEQDVVNAAMVHHNAEAHGVGPASVSAAVSEPEAPVEVEPQSGEVEPEPEVPDEPTAKVPSRAK